MSRKIASGVVAVVLVCAPMGLVAQEREVGSVVQASVVERLGGLWSEIAAWFGATLEGRCTIDPNGCPSGG